MTSLDRIRTDVVGSLLRPAEWKQARLALETGKLGAAEFARVELECVKRHVALQEAIGLDVVTDGEVSRLNFQDSFGLAVSGYDAGSETMKTQEKRASATSLTRWEIPDLAAPGTPVPRWRRRAPRSRADTGFATASSSTPVTGTLGACGAPPNRCCYPSWRDGAHLSPRRPR